MLVEFRSECRRVPVIVRSEFHPPDNEMKKEERATSEVIVDRPAEYAQDMEFGKCGVDDTCGTGRGTSHFVKNST